MQVVMEERVPAVFTSAGSPKTWTGQLHAAGCKVAHVVSSTKFALKCQEAGVDAVVAEGFEAGGHNGREETATMALVPQVRAAITIPLIAAGGIATGRDALEFIMAGAAAVQVGAANFANPRAMETIADEMAAWMDKNGVKTLDEIRGCARNAE